MGVMADFDKNVAFEMGWNAINPRILLTRKSLETIKYEPDKNRCAIYPT